MSIIDYNIKFIPEMKYLCAKNCAYQILDYMGVETPLEYLYIGFMPYICAYKNDFFPSGKILSISGETSIINAGFDRNFDKVLECNKAQLASGYQPILLVDTFYLPYRKEYMKYHGTHSIILSDIRPNQVEIIDWYDSVLFKGEIPFRDFYNARNSSYSDTSNPFSLRPIENKWFYIKPESLTYETRKLIINENLLTLQFAKKVDNKFEKTGLNALVFLLQRLLPQMNDTEEEKKQILKKVHDALFPFLCTSRLMNKYVQTSKFVGDDITQHIYTIVQCLEVINYNSMRCSIVYKRENHDKTFEALNRLIIMYQDLQKCALSNNLII